MEFRSGFVSIIGRPNTGKSTFLNHVLDYRLSITTKKPQTTRQNIQGIWNGPQAQIIFLDTPGVHEVDRPLNRYMLDSALSGVSDADIVIMMTQPSDRGSDLKGVVSYLERSEARTILVLNKSDLIDAREIRRRLDEAGDLYGFIEKLSISSLSGRGIPKLMDCLIDALPEGPRYFPEDMISDKSMRFICQELIREKVFTLTHREVPYAVAVQVEEFREDDDPVYIGAVIHVERTSQKAIIIGKSGSMLKEIGRQARKDMQRLLGQRVYLHLFVRVTRDWSKNPRMMKELGYK
ncbi:MAG: GTPase Era [Thermodesulfobacteriota bacterium]|nr:GTPase Era [Thermodesulfobacteriota bacterium]